LELSLPAGRLVDVAARPRRGGKGLARSTPLKLPGPSPPELPWAVAAPKTIFLSLDVEDLLADACAEVPSGGACVVLDAGGLSMDFDQVDGAATPVFAAAAARAAASSCLADFRKRNVARGFAVWDDGTSFPWTTMETTSANLSALLDDVRNAEARSRAAPMFENVTDVIVVADGATPGKRFDADRLREFFRTFPEITFHVVAALRRSDAVVAEEVEDVAAAATGATVYATLPPPLAEVVDAPAPSAAVLDLPEPTMDAAEMEDLWDSI